MAVVVSTVPTVEAALPAAAMMHMDTHLLVVQITTVACKANGELLSHH